MPNWRARECAHLASSGNAHLARTGLLWCMHAASYEYRIAIFPARLSSKGVGCAAQCTVLTILPLAQGFEDEVLSVLIKRYPPNLLADLQARPRWCL